MSGRDSSGAPYFLLWRASEHGGCWQVEKDCPFPMILQQDKKNVLNALNTGKQAIVTMNQFRLKEQTRICKAISCRRANCICSVNTAKPPPASKTSSGETTYSMLR